MKKANEPGTDIVQAQGRAKNDIVDPSKVYFQPI